MVEFGINGDANIAASRILVPVALATVLPGVSFGGGGGGGGTIATVLSPVPISGTVTASPPAYIGTLASMGTVGTVQSLPNMAVASLVGSVGALPNIAVASLVGSIGSPIVVGGGTVGTVQSLPNIAVASLVGSVGSPVVIAGGTIGTIMSPLALSGSVYVGSVSVIPSAYIGTIGTLQSGVTDIGTLYGGMLIDPLYGPAKVTVATAGIASIVIGAQSYFGLPSQSSNRRLFSITAAALGAAGTLTVFNAGSVWLQMVVPANDTRFWESVRGVAFGGGPATLYASLAGTMSVQFVAGG